MKKNKNYLQRQAEPNFAIGDSVCFGSKTLYVTQTEAEMGFISSNQLKYSVRKGILLKYTFGTCALDSETDLAYDTAI